MKDVGVAAKKEVLACTTGLPCVPKSLWNSGLAHSPPPRDLHFCRSHDIVVVVDTGWISVAGLNPCCRRWEAVVVASSRDFRSHGCAVGDLRTCTSILMFIRFFVLRRLQHSCRSHTDLPVLVYNNHRRCHRFFMAKAAVNHNACGSAMSVPDENNSPPTAAIFALRTLGGVYYLANPPTRLGGSGLIGGRSQTEVPRCSRLTQSELQGCELFRFQ